MDPEGFERVCKLHDETYSQLIPYPKSVRCFGIHNNHFSCPIWDMRYFRDQVASNCRYKKHVRKSNEYLCDGCLTKYHDAQYIELGENTYVANVKGGELNYFIGDIDDNIYANFDDPYNLRYRYITIMPSISYLDRSAHNLEILKKQIAAMRQIISAQKWRKQLLSNVKFRRYWYSIYFLRIVFPDEVLKEIAKWVAI